MPDQLDQPLPDSRLRWLRRTHPAHASRSDGFGRFAEATARFMGSPRFVLYMTIFVIAWIGANLMLAGISEEAAWDPYPFILLNLAFSTQASYSAPLIMLAQNRQDARDRVVAEQDRIRAERNLADTEYLAREIAGLRLALQDMGFQTVQLSSEGDSGIGLFHQPFSPQMGHVLGLLPVSLSRHRVHIGVGAVFSDLRPAHGPAGARLGCFQLDSPLFQVFPGCGRDYGVL